MTSPRPVVTAANPGGELSTLSQPVVFAIDVERPRVWPYLREAAAVLWFSDVTDGVAKFDDGEGNPIFCRETPLAPLAVIRGSNSSGKERALLAWLRDVGSRSEPPVVDWSPGKEAHALAHILREASRVLRLSARGRVQANKELIALRLLNEDLQNRSASIESLVARKGLQPCDLAFNNDPIETPTSPNVVLEAGQDSISQILPVASTGVSAIAIHLRDARPTAQYGLTARLVCLEDQRIVEKWVVQAADLGAAWNVLALKRALTGIRRTLELRLSFEGEEGELPVLSLGGPQPVELFRVRNAATGGALARSSLALQVWCGLPGVALPGGANVVTGSSKGVTAAQSFREIPIAPGVLALVAHANVDEGVFEAPAVVALPEDHAIGCHPPATGLTIGHLTAICPPGALCVSASVYLDHESSLEVDFAVAVARDLEQARLVLEGNRDARSGEAFSGWRRVAHGQTHRLSAFIAEQVDTWQSIYMATRMSTPGNNSYAWAKFRDLCVMVNA